jgi:hypothetical protein
MSQPICWAFLTPLPYSSERITLLSGRASCLILIIRTAIKAGCTTKFNRIICSIMKNVYLLLMALVMSFQTIAIPDFGLWCNGQAVLENGEVLAGDISFDLKFEVVRVKKNGIVHAYTAEGLAYFEMYDHIKRIHRKYVSVDSPVHPGYSRRAFFEVISHGELSFLRRSEYVRRPRATEDMRAPHVYLNSICKHIYYLHDAEEGLVQVDNFKKEVLPRMERYEKQVDDYIDRCHLSLKKVHEQVRVVNLYNQLHAMENKLAAGVDRAKADAEQPALR